MEEHPLTKRTANRLSKTFARAFLLISVVAFGNGCASKPGALALRSNNAQLEYSQRFTRAYYSRNENGEYDVVLLEDGIVPRRAKSDAPIVASASAPLNQTVHIRVLWRPLRGSKPDAPSATNSVIDWYVRTNDSIDGEDHLHYRGAGFVTINESNGIAQFTIKSAKLDLADAGGRLRDPLGTSSLVGEFKAVQNGGMVSSTIQELTAPPPTKNLTPAAASHDGPPPRPVTGP